MFTFALLCIVLILGTPLLWITYRRPRRDAWFWVLVIAPPLLLSPLFVLPARDPVTLIFLLPFYVCLPVSLVFFVIRIIQVIIRLARKEPATAVAGVALKLIRPGLVILIFIASSISQRMSLASADQYTIATAHNIQAQCDKNGKCPTLIDGWKSAPDILSHKLYSTSRVRRLGIEYQIDYDVAPDDRSFSVTIIHGFNMGVSIKGGPGKTLKAFRYNEESMHEIPLGKSS